MKYYKSFKEKGQYFLSGDRSINSFHELLYIIDKINNNLINNDLIFRGQPEAKFMLFNSLQRLWIGKGLDNHYDSFSELINNLISQCKNWDNGLIPKYINYFGSTENELSYLSIMQHYGLPTPLLDFTLDIYKSLFFAIENIDFSPANSEIEKYFSIYYILKDNNALFISEYFLDELTKFRRKNNLKKNKDLSTISKFDMLLIDNTDLEYRIQNNLNIINQNGVFIYNSSPTEPLESQYLKNIELFKKIGKNNIKVQKEVGGCLNINKKLADQISAYLKSKGIDRNSIYPDLNKLKIECLNQEWKKINAE